MLNVEGWQNKTHFIWLKRGGNGSWYDLSPTEGYLLDLESWLRNKMPNEMISPEHWWVVVSPRLFFLCVIRETCRQLSASFLSPLDIQRVLNCLADWEGCFTGHTFPWWRGWQVPVSLQEVEWWEEWKRAMFSSRTITLWKLWHWFANISFLWLPEAFINMRYHGVYDSELMK